jgi:hypothetical protein
MAQNSLRQSANIMIDPKSHPGMFPPEEFLERYELERKRKRLMLLLKIVGALVIWKLFKA